MKTNAKQEPAAVKYNQSLKVCGLSAALCDAQPAHVRSRTHNEAARLLPSAPIQHGPFLRHRAKLFPTPGTHSCPWLQSPLPRDGAQGGDWVLPDKETLHNPRGR